MAFSKNMVGLKPKVRLTDPSDVPSHAGVSAEKPIEVLDDEESVLGKRRAPTNLPATPSKRQRAVKPEDGRAPSASPSMMSAMSRPGFASPMRASATTENPFARFKPLGARTLRDIRDVIDRMGPAGIPSVVDLRVHRELCKEAVKPWEGPTVMFLDIVMKMVQDIIDAGLRVSFQDLQRRAIFEKCKQAMERFLLDQRIETEKLLRKELSFHSRKVFTVNKEDLDRLWKDEKDNLHHYRHYMRWKMYTSTVKQPNDYVPLDLIPQERRGAEEREHRDQVARMGKDPFEEELNVYAYVRAYYRLAVARFIDSVALILYSDMVPAVEEKLADQLYLAQEIGVIPPQEGVYEELMKEQDWITAKRQDLKREIERFQSAMGSIAHLESKINGPSAAGRSYPTPRSMSDGGEAMDLGTI
jgi:hypothetical protein